MERMASKITLNMSYSEIELQREAQRSSEYDEFSYCKQCKKPPS